MADHTVTLVLPDILYSQLEQRAAETQRSVADEVIETMTLAFPTSADLDSSIAHRLEALPLLNDEQLWQSAQHSLSRRKTQRLHTLSQQNGRGELTVADEAELALLLDQLEDVGVIRAKAAALLKERGHDVTSLLPRE